MDITNSLVRDTPSSTTVEIPSHLAEAATWCADNGYRLTDPAHPHVELRQWALSQQREEFSAAVRSVHTLRTIPQFNPLTGADSGWRNTRYKSPEDKKRLRAQRKLQKARKLAKKRNR